VNAEDRAWEVVRRAFEEREPRRRPGPRTLHAALAAAALVVVVAVAAALSPPGHAVFERVKRAVGVENAARRLGPLPAPGRLLVVGPAGGGAWIVDRDGTKHSLGAWQDAVWSPHGRYVLATRSTELVALEPNGKARWTLRAASPLWPAWEGTLTDTRIAYRAKDGLHVVAGDGTGDRVVDAHAEPVPPAWDPARLHTLAYVSGHALVLRSVDDRRVLWRTHLTAYGRLAWSSDGTRLAVVTPGAVDVFDGAGRRLRVLHEGAAVDQAVFRPGAHVLTVVRHRSGRSEVTTVDVDHPRRRRLLFAGPGAFGDVAWSPDAKWLLVDWRTANQWVFLHGATVRAVGRIAQQFPRGDDLPVTLELASGWCCPADHGAR
jgi:hypothetical protein